MNRVFVPCVKGAVSTENGENDGFAFYPTENKGLAPQTPENDENDENGGCHSGKGMV